MNFECMHMSKCGGGCLNLTDPWMLHGIKINIVLLMTRWLDIVYFNSCKMLRTMWYNLLIKIAKKSIIAQHEKIERTALQPSISINKGDDKIF